MSFSKSFDFSTLPAGADVTEPSTGLYWLNTPQASGVEEGRGFAVTPTPGSDYWRKTYTEPPADRASGNGLVVKVPSSVGKWSVSTEFSMTMVDQYDQAGLMVYVDDHHWLKTGIEYEGGVANMSCVVTNGQSDWNYFPWPSVEGVQMKAVLERCKGVLACTVEYNQSGVWRVLREAPITMETDSEVSVGVMCAAPKNKEGTPAMKVVFKNLAVTAL